MGDFPHTITALHHRLMGGFPHTITALHHRLMGDFPSTITAVHYIPPQPQVPTLLQSQLYAGWGNITTIKGGTE